MGTTKPERITLRRTKHWKMPAGAVSVARPTKWGNPFVTGPDVPIERAIGFFRECLMRAVFGGAFPAGPYGSPLLDSTINRFRTMARDLGDLQGKPLACWCKPGKKCHADILIEFANGGPAEACK